MNKTPLEPHGKYLVDRSHEAQWKVELYYDGDAHYVSCFGMNIGITTYPAMIHYQDQFMNNLVEYKVNVHITHDEVKYYLGYTSNIPESHKKVITEAIRIMHSDYYEYPYIRLLRDLLVRYTRGHMVPGNFTYNFIYPLEVTDKVVARVSDFLYDPRR